MKDLEFIKEIEEILNIELPEIPMFNMGSTGYEKDSKGNIVGLNFYRISIGSLEKIITILKKFSNLKKLTLSSITSGLNKINQLSQLTELQLTDTNLNDLSQIQGLKNLKKLVLWKNPLGDLSHIYCLNKLTELHLNEAHSLDYSALKELPNLSKLSLTDSPLKEFSFLKDLRSLTDLSIANQKNANYEAIKELPQLKKLRLHNIEDISVVQNLTNLETLDLSVNAVEDISPLSSLTKLEDLNLSWNKIRDISPLKYLTELKALDLHRNHIKELSPIEGLIHLTTLKIGSHHHANHDTQISDISALKNLVDLTDLLITDTQIKDITVVKAFVNLNKFHLTNTPIGDNIKPLKYLLHLTDLTLVDTEISDINSLANLHNLTKLNLSINKIKNVSPLTVLKKIVSLQLGYNQIVDCSFLEPLTSLSYLDLSNNKIVDISSLDILNKLSNLKSLQLNSNPFEKKNDLILNPNENHLDIIRGFLIRQKEEEKKPISLPAKVLLLGNHASGKSSLLHYLKNDVLEYKGNSTHLLSIENYYINEESNGDLPDAIFYDFGGQDYYHGIYRVFMSIETIYLLLWNKEGDQNQTITDSNELLCRNYHISYWLGQKGYFEKQKSHKDDPTLLIQTHGDKDERISLGTSNQSHKINNEFYISLKTEHNDTVNSTALAYLKASTDNLIKEKQVKKEEPIWYKEFIKFILEAQKTNNHKPTNIEKDLLPMYKLHKAKDDDERLSSLKTELSQFHKKGMILYYPEVTSEWAWLNPTAFTNYVHEKVFSKENINSKKNGKYQFKNIDKNVLKLLKHQMVIFEDSNYNKKEYIIPNYLPLAEDSDKILDYDLLTFEFSHPFFTLKFKDFLPIGLINQLICWFGNNRIKFWRDQLLFTFKESKVLIRLDFEYLEIKVFIVSKHSSQISSIAEYIFYCILGLYWDLELMDYDSYDQPTSNEGSSEISGTSSKSREAVLNTSDYQSIQLYISLDGQYFVNYQKLREIESDGRIGAFPINEQREILYEQKEIPVHPFQIFTIQPLTKMKKVFVSYSHDDIDYKRELEKYLVNLVRENIIEIWQDGLIVPGEKWDTKIKDALEKADIIILLVSQSFIESRYVYEVEMRKSLRKVEEGSARIIPVLLKNCDWAKWKVLPDKIDPDAVNDNKGTVGQYQFLPMQDGRLVPLNKWQYQEDVWTDLVKYIRKMS